MEQTANQKLTVFLQQNPNSTKQSISDFLDLKGLALFNLLKRAQSEKLISCEGEGSEVTYSLVVVKEADAIEHNGDKPSSENDLTVISENNGVVKSEGGAIQTPESVEKAKVVKTNGRNNDKYTFEGAEYGKGKLVLAVVSAYVAKHPKIKYAGLQKAFPPTLMKRFGVFETVEKAKKLSGPRDRYFFQTENVINLADEKVVVCTQWTSILMTEFITVATGLGFAIQ